MLIIRQMQGYFNDFVGKNAQKFRNDRKIKQVLRKCSQIFIVSNGLDTLLSELLFLLKDL